MRESCVSNFPFTKFNEKKLGDLLENLGFQRHCDEILYNGRTGEQLNYLQLGKEVESIRDEYEKGNYRVEITGFAKMISDIANEAYNVVIFFALAFILTVLAVYWYSRSWTLTFLPLFLSPGTPQTPSAPCIKLTTGEFKLSLFIFCLVATLLLL